MTAADEQRQHWSATFAAHPEMYGDEPSEAAVAAAEDCPGECIFLEEALEMPAADDGPAMGTG